MHKNITKTIFGVAGLIAIGVACYSSKSGESLWALILLSFLIDSVD